VDEYKIPSVIAGFENGDLITAIYRIINQINNGKAILENVYPRVVSYNGNIKARDIINKYFEPYDDIWRGIGVINQSGLAIKKEYSSHDARLKYDISIEPSLKHNGCMCGEIIKGVADPVCCPLFGNACTPENPMGPCMVSSEGSCAAHYKYQIL
jgi:hydrogenase expression/formation protein HypD